MTTNVEWFAFGAGLGHDPAKTGEPQTHRNYAWRDYGNRIGVWRLLELFDELKLPAAHNTNSLVYEYAPQVMAAIRKRADDPINIQYTSGTTGFPKGATLSHHNILNNGYFVGELVHYSELDRIAIPVPFYHCFGMVMG